MWKKWIPWRFIISRIALGKGFIDPIALMAQMKRFAQPSEVMAPIELLRLSAVLQARGLMNLEAIQHNLDWIWPHWVVHQFDPRDKGFVPRAFSLTHINLTHRNWTAVGLPTLDQYPIVDPRGLLTPHFDSWSVDVWLIRENGRHLIPARLGLPAQRMTTEGNLAIESFWKDSKGSLSSRIEMFEENDLPVCRMQVKGATSEPGWIAVSLRPYNPEGVNLVHDICRLETGPGWLVNKKHAVYFSDAPDRHAFSSYAAGDVFAKLPAAMPDETVKCDVGMASAAALFQIPAGKSREIAVAIPLAKEKKSRDKVSLQVPASAAESWKRAVEGTSVLKVPDTLYQYLFDTAVRTVILHSATEIFPGPYTYKHFWFRDAAIILHAMLAVGMHGRAERVLDGFPDLQTVGGYFRSQEGEWDSNGQVLWIMHRYQELTGRPVKEAWRNSLCKAARWILHKRVSEKLDKPHSGLFPAGFSAEHLGPNDFYFWDDFWGVAGLRAASALASSWGDEGAAQEYTAGAHSFMRSIIRSLDLTAARLGHQAMPASPYRRMDTGAIGSLCVDYPLQLWEPGNERVMATLDYLIGRCFVEGGFFHDMSHSGINPYLTLHIAQALLRAGDLRGIDIAKNVALLASPTGQWPEAIHPTTKGGCMGDGQHVWAAAEWLLLVRNSFAREEGEALIVASGIPAEWLSSAQPISMGPVWTSFGPVTVTLEPSENGTSVSCRGEWRKRPSRIEVRLPLHEPVELGDKEEMILQRAERERIV